jgi:glycosyltransferase involved in cell wall biosynthesis
LAVHLLLISGGGNRLRVTALLATYNEERFIGGCLNHLFRHGVDVYLIDNESTDATVAIAEQYFGRGLIGIERFHRDGVFRFIDILRRKEALAAELDSDWFIHLDADEIRLPPSSGVTLREAIQTADQMGYNAINFQEFTFLPTQEPPDHDHPSFADTMRWYYPFLPAFPHRLNAWKRQNKRVDLASGAGHRVVFDGLSMFPVSFPMRHYIFLSRNHALAKYGARRHDPAALKRGWHQWRENFTSDSIQLPFCITLRTYELDYNLDAHNPHTSHQFLRGSDL